MLVAEDDTLAFEQLEAEFRFSRVMAGRFGEDARSFPDRYLIPPDDYLAAARDGTVRIDGYAATVSHPRWPQPIRLRRVAGQWRLDLTPAADDPFTPETRSAVRRAWISIWKELADEVSAGKHKDVDEVHRACGAKMGRITQATLRSR
jgi:hypothetical protein